MFQKALILALLLALSACKNDDNINVFVAKEKYDLPGDTLFPEGIAYRNGYFYTGSTTSGDIIKVDVRTGGAITWASGAAQGRKAATGLRLDDKNHLWVCGGTVGNVAVLDENGTQLKLWDLKTMFGARFINDCISDGTYMYFTDSKVQKIYRAAIADAPTTMEEWLTFTNAQIPYDTAATNANGIVISPDGRYLIIVVSASGKMYRITRADKTITEIALNTPVTAGDGMVLDGTKLYISRNAQNMIYPVTLSANYDSGTVGNGFGSGLDFNTTMAKVDNYLLTVNGQLNKRTARNQTLPFSVVRVTIP